MITVIMQILELFISVRMFSAISYDKISGIHLKEETKQAIRELIDQLYDEYVGIHLKSKKFIDQMKSWATRIKDARERHV